MRRLGTLALRLARTVLADARARSDLVARDERVVTKLGRSIGAFVVRLNAASMAPESARRLPLILRVARYYETVTEVATELARAGREAGAPESSPAVHAQNELLAHTATLLARVDPGAGGGPEQAGEDLLASFEARYQTLKAHLLEAGAAGAIAIPAMEVLLRRASLARRVAEQAIKAARALARLAERDARAEATEGPDDEPAPGDG